MQMCFREFPTFKFFKIIFRHLTEGSIWFLFHFHAAWNFQYLMVCNVPFLLGVFTYVSVMAQLGLISAG